MKYISIDIETTGLDPEKCQILSIGAVLEDTNLCLPWDEIPKFNVAILREEVTGSLRALTINKDLISMIDAYQTANKEKKEMMESAFGVRFLKEEQVTEEFFHWAWEHGADDGDWIEYIKGAFVQKNGKTYPSVSRGKMPRFVINVAGKNFASFDLHFLKKLPNWERCIQIRQRIIDPAVLYANWGEDKSLPSLDTCKERAGVKGNVTHVALDDAWDVVQLLRKTYMK